MLANKAISLIDIYDVHFKLQGNPIKCTGYIIKSTDDINRIKNKMALPLIEWVTLNGLPLQGKDPAPQDRSKWHWQTAAYF